MRIAMVFFIFSLWSFFLGCARPFQAQVEGPESSSLISQGGQAASASVGNSSSKQLQNPEALGASRLRRLTNEEVINSLRDQLGLDLGSLVETLPQDISLEPFVNPFNNNEEAQSVSPTLIQAYESFANSIGELVAVQGAQLESVIGCAPAAVADPDCFRKAAASLGQRILRRDLSTAELTQTLALLSYATESGNFFSAVGVLVSALIQHPEFLYKIEIGSPSGIADLNLLSSLEIAARMSFLLWGSAPDLTLLAAAKLGKLNTESDRMVEFERMWSDKKASRQWVSFHSQWLGMSTLSYPAHLESDLLLETSALIDRVVFKENESLLNIFSYDKSYMTPLLAAHYAMPAISSPQWVNYVGGRGGGILAHGSFLKLGSKFGDTSPSLRGYQILKRLYCEPLVGVIPAGVDTDLAPPSHGGSNCKVDRYYMKNSPSCKGCHAITDGLGFGLENFGSLGEWRSSDLGQPSCLIEAKGDVFGEAYTGPTELGQKLRSSYKIPSCIMKQVFRFATGRSDLSSDQELLTSMLEEFSKDQKLKSLLLALVKSPAFIHRSAK